RWLDATGDKIGSDTGRPAASWPRSRQVDLADTMVAISRTLPAYKGRSEVREIEALYRDAIAAARNFIYIENQYLTSAAVIDALRQSLTNEAGPEIVLVLPYQSDGWLARSTMDAIRSRAGNELREVDSHHRLRIVHPVLNESDSPLFVHSKIMVVDDGLITIGSANLNNRSMGLDSECNLAVAAVENRQVANALARFRNRLVAEHLGVRPDEVAEAIARQGSLIETITELGGGSGRNLKELDCASSVWLDSVKLVQDPSLFDPEEPTKIDCILDQFVHEQDERYEVRGLLKIGIIALILIGMAAAWRWTPLAELIDIRKLTTAVQGLRGSYLLPLLTVGVYMVASFLMVPVSLLIGMTAILFPSIWGVIYALTGCLLSSAAHYLVGSKLGKNTVRKLAGPKLNRLSKKLSKDGWLAIMLIRNLPVAPFALVNMIAGASHIKFKDFLLGTALGMAPGIVAIVLFADRLLMALAEPGLLNALLATAAAALVAIGIWVIRRRISHEEHPERA
ncbi:MAG: VTT domain-containing protein, partial [Desulforhabdus sp.]|nr:VTT domain-containing protein [Desulforhabdus sp.]